MNKLHRTTTAALAAALLAVGLTACSGADSSTATEPRTVEETVSTGTIDDVIEDSESAEPTEEATPEEPELVIYAFGDKGALPNGMEVQVSELRPYDPGPGAAIGKGDKAFVAYTVTLTNNTGKIYDASDYTSSATTGDREAEEVYDGDIGGSPYTKVLPGRSISFDQAYGVDKGSDFVLYVDPMWSGGKELIFAS